jgi:hypothetical protein
MHVRAEHGHSNGAIILRLLVYAVVCAGTFELLVLACAVGWGEAATAENGPVEATHLLLAAASAFLFSFAAHRSQPQRGLFSLLTIGAATLAVRELDRIIDRHLVAGAQEAMFTAAAIAGGFLVWQGRHSLPAQVNRFVESWAAGLLFAAMTVILLFSQLIGQRELWSGLMGDRYMWQVKRTAEESAELFGQLLLLFAAVESFIWAGCRRKSEAMTADPAIASARGSGDSLRRQPAASGGRPDLP